MARRLTFADIDAAANAAEEAEGKHGRRVVRLFCSDEKLPELFYGTYGNAPVEAGDPGYQLSDGEIVTL